MDVAYASARDRLGRTLGGKYRLVQVLGVGGTAVVYRAEGPDGFVALKLLHDWLGRSEEVSRRFMREGYVGNVLDHRGTVRVLDAGNDDDGSAFLVLELLDGESLEERRVRCGGSLPLEESLDIVDQLLRVLDVAHQKGIVHRDIKPSNLFLMRDGTLKVLDFGIARLVNDTNATSTKTGQMIGTPAFMPPEQALSRPSDVDARTDLWSVGATLFTLLSGELVHVAQSSSEHLVKAATLHARSLAKAYRGVPIHVEEFVAKALAFDKAERWQSASEMRTALARVQEDPGRRIGTSTSPPPERADGISDITVLTTRSSGRPASGDRGDRPSDATMSISEGELGVRGRKRRRTFASVALGASVVLLLTSIVVLLVAVRSTKVVAAKTSIEAREARAQAGQPMQTASGAPPITPTSVLTTTSAGPETTAEGAATEEGQGAAGAKPTKASGAGGASAGGGIGVGTNSASPANEGRASLKAGSTPVRGGSPKPKPTKAGPKVDVYNPF